ncbi:hypothetical protein DFH09DRAFT_930656 [Mycena vulgaris]|nr:hypothetical protein DFH09DRAFT_930656 [Mycena vulgaris]
MHGSLIHHWESLSGFVPPKLATPNLVVRPCFPAYSALPKGPAPAIRGLKARFFSGKNASAGPMLSLIGGLFWMGYTLDYQREFAKHHKNNAH